MDSIEDDNSPYVQSAELSVEGSNHIGQTGFFLGTSKPNPTVFMVTKLTVTKSSPKRDILHTSVQYLPSWFPGARFKRRAATWGKAVSAMYDLPWNAATEAVLELCVGFLKYVYHHYRLELPGWAEIGSGVQFTGIIYLDPACAEQEAEGAVVYQGNRS